MVTEGLLGLGCSTCWRARGQGWGQIPVRIIGVSLGQTAAPIGIPKSQVWGLAWWEFRSLTLTKWQPGMEVNFEGFWRVSPSRLLHLLVQAEAKTGAGPDQAVTSTGMLKSWGMSCVRPGYCTHWYIQLQDLSGDWPGGEYGGTPRPGCCTYCNMAEQVWDGFERGIWRVSLGLAASPAGPGVVA